MANAEALEVVKAAVGLCGSHPSAPAIDVLGLVMKGRKGLTLDFVEARARHTILADPSSEFGQIDARALDQGMTAAEWVAFTYDKADSLLRDACLAIWREEISGVPPTNLPDYSV